MSKHFLLNCSRAASIDNIKSQWSSENSLQNVSSKFMECWYGKYLLIFLWMYSLRFIEPFNYFDSLQTLRCWLILISRSVTEYLFIKLLLMKQTKQFILNMHTFPLYTLLTPFICAESKALPVSTKQTAL